MIHYQNVEVTYGDFVALPSFDLRIEAGEFFTLLGPSGCGKSTALRSLAGFISPSSGRIEINDRDVTFAPSHKRGIGMVFQNYALFPSMNVRENIEFGLKTAKVPAKEIDLRVTEVAEQVSLTDVQLEKQISELSGGQQQRVAIARALVMKPEILLLDEPLSNLDARLRQQLRVQLKELQSEVGITTLYVTHDQEEALSMSDRIAVLNEGHIEQVGTPEELYNHSATEFVCNFLGEVNQISDAQVRALNHQGAELDPAQTHYIRLEKVRFAQDDNQLRGIPTLPATITRRHYFGGSSSYDAECLGSRLRVSVHETGERAFDSDEIYLGIDPRWVRSYGNSNGSATEAPAGTTAHPRLSVGTGV